MSEQTRREFLKAAAAAGGSLAMGPLAGLAAEDGAVLTPAATSVEMAIARWQTAPASTEEMAGLATRLTGRAIGALGGMDRFVSKGDVVWVKPNIGWNRAPELAANTNPQVVAELVRLCLEAGAKKVRVGDNPCRPPKQTYRRSGIAAAAKAAGAEIVYLDESRFKEVDLGGQRLILWPLAPEILDADLLINVPVAKHHGLSQVTLCMKNYMGIIGGQRSAWHQDLSACLCDITAYLKPRLCVLDAVRTLTAHGPQGGNPEDVAQLGTVAAGTDIVALDAFGAELLGHRPEDIQTVTAAADCGLGRMDYRALAPAEMAVS